MPKAGEIRYCPELGGEATNAAFVWIPPGSFWMGSQLDMNNTLRFIVIAKGLWLQQTPLTKAQYGQGTSREALYSNSPQGDLYWKDIVAFCADKPLRMPTQAEWEYAARANTGHKYLWAGSNVATNVAWIDDNARNVVQQVRQLKSNSYGLFDMSGNVEERCSYSVDRQHSKNTTHPVRGAAPKEIDAGPALEPILRQLCLPVLTMLESA